MCVAYGTLEGKDACEETLMKWSKHSVLKTAIGASVPLRAESRTVDPASARGHEGGSPAPRAHPSLADDRQEFVETPRRRNRASRGVLTGVLLGIVLWLAILALTGVIKL